MHRPSLSAGLVFLLAGLACGLAALHGQEVPAEPPPGPPPPVEVPRGVEVLARGPVHEAFASPTAEPAPTHPVSRKPPAPIEELTPADKPEGDVTWIGGYWAWDDDRSDFLWVSGVWRTPPPGKQWVPGYWREEGDNWQYVSGFWTAAAPDGGVKEVAYLPKPPEPLRTAPPGEPPAADCFFIPPNWAWTGTHYAWRAGYWARVQPGYVWVPDHFRWTPGGCVFVAGYWDLAFRHRGVLYAPVVITPAVVTTSFSYTPVYAVSDTIVVESLFVRPAYGHYYFGDYYGPAYVNLGFQNVYVYGGARYDSIVVYEHWAHRNQPNWINVQINLYNDRSAGRAPRPPRTLLQQTTIIRQNVTNVTNVTIVAPAAHLNAARGVKTVSLDAQTRAQARQQATVVQQVALQRTRTETPLPPGAPSQTRKVSLSVPAAQAVKPGFVAPAASAHAPPLRAISSAGGPAQPPAAHPAHGAPPHPASGPQPIHAPPHPAAGHVPGRPPGAVPAPAAHPGQPPAHRPPPRDSKEHHTDGH
jgi:hypothetical protein